MRRVFIYDQRVGNNQFYAGLNDGARAVRAGEMRCIQNAAFDAGSAQAGIIYGVSFRMFKKIVFGWAFKTFKNIVIDTSDETVVSGCADFLIRADDNGSGIG